MTTQHQEKRTPHDRSEGDLDESMKESFPASDPPAIGGATRIEKGNSERGEQPKEDEPDKNKPGGSEAERKDDDDH